MVPPGVGCAGQLGSGLAPVPGEGLLAAEGLQCLAFRSRVIAVGIERQERCVVAQDVGAGSGTSRSVWVTTPRAKAGGFRSNACPCLRLR